ncbi:hypothetical protein EW146_g9233 [Bondarzewia mesenterica]|uniref:Uncharacterized protein n=1 Tax=Bondarzewia mesenterica TaxID=1095465 RepID=A0A4S4L8G0_9AGAM|nr:hypothetical protein EW146_g9233 [Bondarzewia mesenterica]
MVASCHASQGSESQALDSAIASLLFPYTIIILVMPAHLLLIMKLKEVLSDHMKLLLGTPAEPEDYVVWGKMFIGYLNLQNHLEMLDGFVPDADVTKWVEEWGMRVLPQLSALVTREHEVAAEWENVHVQQEQVAAAKAKEEERLAHHKVREAEKLALLMANKISPDDFECNSDDDLMLLDLVSLGELEGDTEMTALTSETGGDVSGASDAEKGKGHAEKRKTTKVLVSDAAVTAKQSKRTTRDPKLIPEGAILVNNTCYRCVTEFHVIYACYQLPGADSAILTIKVELANKKGSSSAGPRPKPTAHSSGSSTSSAVAFLKKSVAEREKLASEVAASVEPGTSLPSLINTKDMITWHLESNAHELAIILAERKANKRELEKVRRKIRIAKWALGMKEDE